MTVFSEWIKKVFEAVMPSQGGHAWDELKRVRQLKLQQSETVEMQASPMRERVRVHRFR